MNTENLLKLATYLAKLPEDYDHFSMNYWNEDPESTLEHNEPSHCETVACALGHAPYCVSPMKKNEYWMIYAERIFNLPFEKMKFVFDYQWSELDDTPRGAAKRIVYFIKNPDTTFNNFHEMKELLHEYNKINLKKELNL